MEDLDDIFDDLSTQDEEGLEDSPIDKNLDIFDSSTNDSSEGGKSILDVFLSSKGVSNGTLKIIDETDAEKDVNFYEMSQEEQLDVLNSLSNNSQLQEDEEKLINFLRINNLTINEYLEQYKDALLRENYSPQEPDYDIDAYDDQELYLLDLKTKFDLTDDELAIELEKELKNPELFNKKVDKLRAEYKELEQQYKESIRSEELDKFNNTMLDAANSVQEFNGIVLDDTEKIETLEYLTALDDQGRSAFYKDLSDPKKMYEAA
jgi:hypothetical protein